MHTNHQRAYVEKRTMNQPRVAKKSFKRNCNRVQRTEMRSLLVKIQRNQIDPDGVVFPNAKSADDWWNYD
jgi:hypothetical protein